MQWPTTHYLAGSFTDDEPTLPVENPATGETIAHVADAGPEVATAALDAAVDAAPAWAATNPRQRAELLRAAFELIMERADLFAQTMTLEMGKPLKEAHGEVAYGAEFFRWFSEEAARPRGSYGLAPAGGQRIVTTKRPVGPVLAITPWNFPLAMGTRKIGPALAAGCTVVLKPAQLTPLTSLLLMQVLHDVGVPAGVVNCFVSSRASTSAGPLVADPRLRKLTFTGSTSVGVRLLEQAAGNVLRTSMELGGNAPFLVLGGADVDRAVDGAMVAKLRNIGQACTAANRFIVDRRHADEFTTKLAARFASMTVGNGMDEGVDIGPLINAAALDEVLGKVDSAVAEGATVVTGGNRIPGAGHFMEPTVLTGVSPSAEIFSDEIFGPVAPIVAVDSTEEALALANDAVFGLMSYVYSENLDEALSAAERIESGMVGINTGLVSNPAAPFGGVKASGLGREGGAEGIEEYLETVYFGIASPL